MFSFFLWFFQQVVSYNSKFSLKFLYLSQSFVSGLSNKKLAFFGFELVRNFNDASFTRLFFIYLCVWRNSRDAFYWSANSFIDESYDTFCISLFFIFSSCWHKFSKIKIIPFNLKYFCKPVKYFVLKFHLNLCFFSCTEPKYISKCLMGSSYYCTSFPFF